MPRTTPRAALHLSQNTKADNLLSKSPLALLVGMVLDQQVPLEWAFAAPLTLSERLGAPLEAKALATMGPETLRELFSRRPALHRYPGSMAQRVQDLCVVICDQYGGRATGVWAGTQSGTELLDRIKALPGFGEQKAKIFVALLGKQLGVCPPGWREVSDPYGDAGTFRSVADIVDETTLAKVRTFKQEMKAKAKTKAAKQGTTR